MRNIFISLAIILGCGGCAIVGGYHPVTFGYFNLSANPIWVTEIYGLPPDATPGRLEPVHSADQPSEKSSTIPGPIRVPGTLKIIWKDNGKQGWPGGVSNSRGIPIGVTHEATFNRADSGIPATLRSGEVLLTYLGNDQWRTKFVENGTNSLAHAPLA